MGVSRKVLPREDFYRGFTIQWTSLEAHFKGGISQNVKGVDYIKAMYTYKV